MASASPTSFTPGTATCIRLILYDANNPGELERAEDFGNDILKSLRRGRRRPDRRARRWRREARPDGRDVLRGRPEAAAAGEVRLRSRRLAQPGQGLPPAAPLRRAGPHAHPQGASFPSRTCRGFRGWGFSGWRTSSGPRPTSRSPRPWPGRPPRKCRWSSRAGAASAALGRPVQASHSLDLSALTGITLYEPEELVLSAKAGTALAEIEAALKDKNQAARLRARRPGPFARQRARRGDDRRCLGLQPGGPPADQDRGGARPLPRRRGDLGPGRALQVGRPGGQERHRLRPLQAPGRLLRHAGGHDPGDRQGPACAGKDPHGPAERPGSRGGGRRCHDPGARLLPRGLGRGPPAGRSTSGRFPGFLRPRYRRGDHRPAHRGPGAPPSNTAPPPCAGSSAIWPRPRNCTATTPLPSGGKCATSPPSSTTRRPWSGEFPSRPRTAPPWPRP